MQGKYDQYLAYGKILFLQKSYLLVEGGWGEGGSDSPAADCWVVLFWPNFSLCCDKHQPWKRNHKGSRLIYISRKKVELDWEQQGSMSIMPLLKKKKKAYTVYPWGELLLFMSHRKPLKYTTSTFSPPKYTTSNLQLKKYFIFFPRCQRWHTSFYCVCKALCRTTPVLYCMV